LCFAKGYLSNNKAYSKNNPSFISFNSFEDSRNLLVERSKNKFVGSSNYFNWIEHLTQTPSEDFQKLVIDFILAPYLINVRKCSCEESYTIIKNCLDKCDKLEHLQL